MRNARISLMRGNRLHWLSSRSSWWMAAAVLWFAPTMGWAQGGGATPASGTVVNRARATFLVSGARMDSVSAEATIQVVTGGGTPGGTPGGNPGGVTPDTAQAAPNLSLSKEVVSQSGQEITWRLTWTNLSTTSAATGLVLDDSLPPELAFTGATVAPAEVPIGSGGVVRWNIASIAAGQSASVQLTTRVTTEPANGEVTNRATIARGGVAASSATAVVRRQLPRFQLSKGAGVLEAGLGDPVPYTLTLRNAGEVPLRGIVVSDRLPRGMRFAGDHAAGADSVRVDGQAVTMYVAGPLEPGATHAISYVAVLAEGRAGATLVNVAMARAGSVNADSAIASVRVRGDASTQVVVGRVWLDANGNGVQDGGEGGVGNVRIWSADGQVVTTDHQGRFSFSSLRSGTHLFRVDTLGLDASVMLPDAVAGRALVRADGWTMPRVEFRLVRRPVAPGAAVQAVEELARGEGAEAPRARGDSLAMAPAVRPARIAPLRSAEERRDDERLSLVMGPGVALLTPTDGEVVFSNRAYVGVKGEPGASVRIHLGDSVIAAGVLRPDGAQDFIGIALPAGQSHVRVEMKNSWGNTRWDSIAVHRAGSAARITAESVPTLRQGVPGTMRLLVTDRWGVAVAPGTMVSVESQDVTIDGADAEPNSAGVQHQVGYAGMLDLRVTGKGIGAGEVAVNADGAKARIPLAVFASVRDLIITGTAQLGIGATTGSVGAVTAQGALDANTALTVTMDTRRGGDANSFFAQGYDPLAAGRYPTTGDASDRRVVAATTGALSAKLERGMDWVQLGDVQPTGIVGDGKLFTYQRAVSGAQGRVTTGGITWRGFGSMTTQSVDQVQLRADRGMGPYFVGARVRPGTERLTLEIRARENAARVLQRVTLSRFTDYEIDYETGSVLLRRSVTSADGAGNPVFVVAVAERVGGGDMHFVGGLRAEADVAARVAPRWLDSLVVGGSLVHDGTASGIALASGGAAMPRELAGALVRARRNALSAELELLRAMPADSARMAARAEARWELPGDRASVSAQWTHAQAGFAGGLDPRLGAGVDELRVTGSMLAAGTRLTLRHERQRFEEMGASRSQTTIGAERDLGERKLSQEFGFLSAASSGLATGGAPLAGSSLTGRTQLTLNKRLDLTVDASHVTSGTDAAGQPDRIGTSLSYRLFGQTRLEARHELVQSHGMGGNYQRSSARIRSGGVLKGDVWGGVERTASERASHSAVLGWEQRLTVRSGWSLESMAEQRVGLEHAPAADPMRAMPFAQTESDGWLAATSLQYAQGPSKPGMVIRTELRGGTLRQGHRIDVSGDMPLGASGALLTRHEWQDDAYRSGGTGSNGTTVDRVDQRSMLGVALRPSNGAPVDLLAKLEWRRSEDPTSSLSQSGGLALRRFIGAADAVWTPERGTELAARYAIRFTDRQAMDAPGRAVVPVSHLVGGRVERGLVGRFSGRADARMLAEMSSGTSRWSFAPSALYHLNDQVQLEGGYRFGNLVDPDFGREGRGVFATFSMVVTEREAGAAAFWRKRDR